ncbi:MAG: DUF5056 domain-containing protein [Myxococcota bacterium]
MSGSDDWLEGLLTESAHIPDEGFTERVMESLPPARPRERRGWVLAAATACACALFMALDGGATLRLLAELAGVVSPTRGGPLPVSFQPTISAAFALVALLALAWVPYTIAFEEE